MNEALLAQFTPQGGALLYCQKFIEQFLRRPQFFFVFLF